MKIQRKTLWFESKGKVALREELAGEAQLISLSSVYSFVSKGTEGLVLKGLVPNELHEKMKVNYMQGDFSFPINYGYSMVGQFLSGAHSGKYAHVMAPHSSHHFIKEKDLLVLPSEIDLKQATLLSNIETVINAIWDAELDQGDSVLIVGYGGIGQLLGAALSHLGYEFTIYDPVHREFSVLEDSSNKFNKVFHSSATAQGLQLAVDSAGLEGVVIEMSWYGSRRVELKLGGSFHYLRKRIISSQVSQIPKKKQAEWNFLKRKQLAVKWIEEGFFSSILFNEIALEEAPDWYETKMASERNAFNLIKY